MLLFLHGPDTFRSRLHLKKMIKKFKIDRDPEGLNVCRLDCEKQTPDTILGEMLASPFLAERRMVILENFLSSKQKELQKKVLVRIEEHRLPSSNVYVFFEDKDEWKTKEAKALAERLSREKFAQQFSLLTGAKLQKWIATEVKERGGTMEHDAILFLAEHTAGDMWRVSTTMDQLIAYVSLPSSRSITRADVTLFLEETFSDNIFTLVEAIVGKQPKQAFGMIGEQYRKGEDARYIFAMLMRQCRILLQLRDLFEREDTASNDLLAKKLHLHPFVVRKSLPFVKRYTHMEIQFMYDALLTFDIQTKTGQGDQSVLFDVFVAKWCAT